MATLGQQLKAAREAKGVNENDAGAATKILTKMILAMEADDFSVMAAPTYAKGFIRLYAEYLGLNPEPLIEEYLEKHAPARKPLMAESEPSESTGRLFTCISSSARKLTAQFHLQAWFRGPVRFFSNVWNRMMRKEIGTNESPATETVGKIPPVKDIRLLAGAVAGVIVLVVLIVSITNCARRHMQKAPARPAEEIPARTLLDGPPPDLYLVEPGKIESAP